MTNACFLRDPDPPEPVTGCFPEYRHLALPRIVRPRVRTGRDVDGSNAFVLQKFADAEYVISVADGDATVQSVGAHDDADAHGGLGRIPALRFSDQAALGNAVAHQVIAAHAALTEGRIGGSTTRRNDDWCHAAVEHFE